MKMKLKPSRNGHPVCVLCARTGSRRRKRTRRMKMTRTVFAMAVAAMLMLVLSGASQAADCASQRRGYRRPKQGDAGLLVSSPLVSPSLVSPSPSLLARLLRPRALPLVVVALPTDPLTRRADRSRRGIFFSFDQRASHRGTRLNASVRAAGFVPPCALPEGSTVLTSPVRSLIGVLARSNS